MVLLTRMLTLYAYCILLALTLIVTSNDNRLRANYTFTTCGSRDKDGPTFMECTQHYCNSGSLVCGHLLNEGTRGSQIFVVPRSGNYTVTIAGASGGHGVCSDYSGLGVIVRETVQFRRDERIRILVGQQGISACDGHQNIDVCQLSNNDTTTCVNLWNSTYRDMASGNLFLFDGGGGGGGASLVENRESSESDPPIVIAPGGGGAGAIYNVLLFFRLLYQELSIEVNLTDLDVDDLEVLYRNYTYGHADEVLSSLANGTIGIQSFIGAAGAGAGYFRNRFVPRATDPDPLVLDGFGGGDCSEAVRPELVLFPDTRGGFGGGGGGCSGGGGGGGYTGGSIVTFGPASSGEGGYSWPDPPWPFVDYNDGDGYVELFLESCGCTYDCIIHNQSSFGCSCPSDATLALNGFDCYSEENRYLETEEEPFFVLHPNFGNLTVELTYFDNTTFAYSASVRINPDSPSVYCTVWFLNSAGELVSTSRTFNRMQPLKSVYNLELFPATTTTNKSSDPVTISVNVSVNSFLILDEPIPIATIITIGFEGECAVEELIVNATIDDIFEPESEILLNLTASDIMAAYLAAFTFIPTTVAGDATDGLSAGVIVAIIVPIVTVLVIVVLLISIAVILYYKRSMKLFVVQQMKDKNGSCSNDEKIASFILRGKLVDDNHEYATMTPAYENMPNIEMGKVMRKSVSTLKYGFKSPLQNHYHFNNIRKTDDWSYDRAQLIYMREIGEGQFGKVLLMSAKDICGVEGSVLVAVKTLTSTDSKDIQRFSDEMEMMKKFIHPSIVSMLGHCEATGNGAPMMILELMQYGDLKWFLRANRPTEEESGLITDNVALDIVTDVAAALEYLAANKYVHRDVAARNCLIGEGFKAKLSDFGLARGVHETDYYKVQGRTALPVKWMAPESILYGRFTSASDVWSYGVLVWEVATFAEAPHEKLQLTDLVELATNGTLKLDRPEECSETLTDLVSQCNSIQSKDRPTFTEILEYCKRKQSHLSTIVESSCQV